MENTNNTYEELVQLKESTAEAFMTLTEEHVLA